MFDLERPTLAAWAENYIAARDLSPSYAKLIAASVRHFSVFLGRPATLYDLDEQRINAYAASLVPLGLAPQTRKHRIGYLCAIWREAWGQRLVDVEPRRVVKIKVPRRNPVAWTLEEFGRLIAACDSLGGYFPLTGIRRRDFARVMFRLIYETGLRLGDALELRREQFTADGRIIGVGQHKTGHALAPSVTPETLGLVHDLHPWTEERAGIVLHWPQQRERIYELQRRLVLSAGLSPRDGLSRRIRRTGATAVEQQQPGSGWRYLGHAAPGLDRDHYLDRTLLPVDRPLPPPLPH